MSGHLWSFTIQGQWRSKAGSWEPGATAKWIPPHSGCWEDTRKPGCSLSLGEKVYGDRPVSWLGPDGWVFCSEFFWFPYSLVYAIDADCTKHPKKHQHCDGHCPSQQPGLRLPTKHLAVKLLHLQSGLHVDDALSFNTWNKTASWLCVQLRATSCVGSNLPASEVTVRKKAQSLPLMGRKFHFPQRYDRKMSRTLWRLMVSKARSDVGARVRDQ